MRWSEVFANILEKEGYEVNIPEDWDGNDESIIVNGQALWDFVESRGTGDEDSKHELLRNSVYLVTMHFEERVKSFIKNILMDYGIDDESDSAFKGIFQYYSYRVEIQARGMPHIHGVAWLRKEFLEKLGIFGGNFYFFIIHHRNVFHNDPYFRFG